MEVEREGWGAKAGTLKAAKFITTGILTALVTSPSLGKAMPVN